MALKYKVGDRVQIKSLDWYNKNKDVFGKVWTNGGQIPFDKYMSKWCGKVMTISHVRVDHYTMVEDLVGYWTDEMIEGLVEEEIKPKFKVGDILFYRGETSGYLKVEEIREENGEIRYYETSRNIYLVENDPDVFADKVCSVEIEETKNNNDMEEKETLLGWIIESDNLRLVPHKDYEIKHDGDNFYLVKKKKEYPKTYEECAEVLDVCSGETLQYGDLTLSNDYEFNLYTLLENFRKLLICRDAYWKIAGEEMGLGKPWEPDWKNDEQFKYIITCRRGCIIKDTYTAKDVILVFPTVEMRDAFYENFKEEINSCKELL